MILFWKRKKQFLKEFETYNSIETLPIWNWHNIHAEGSLKYLIVSENYNNIDAVPVELIDIWTNLFQEHIDEFGIDEKYADFLKIQKKIAMHEIDAALGDRIKNTLAKVEQAKLKSMLDVEGKITFNDSIAILEKHLHREIDPKKMSVLKYYTHLNLIKKTAPKTKKHGR